jgi:hypothetical protein
MAVCFGYPSSVPAWITEIIFEATARIDPANGQIVIYQSVTFGEFSPEGPAHTVVCVAVLSYDQFHGSQAERRGSQAASLRAALVQPLVNP